MMNWKTNSINVAIQTIPQVDGKISYAVIDKVIGAIAESGYSYKVCPFETVVECEYAGLPSLLEKIHDAARIAGAGSMLTNLKIQVDFEKNVTIGDKMEKYW